jgi:hypothetical protein
MQNDVTETVADTFIEITPKGAIATALMGVGAYVVGRTLVRGIRARKPKTSPLPPPAPVIIETTAR